MRIKLSLGKQTIRSIEFQVTTILSHLHNGTIEIRKTRPHRTDMGNYVWITYRTSLDRNLTYRRNFSLQRIGDLCDVWLDSPSNQIN